eukprot:635391-Amphidinium_carterae.1
MEETLLPLKGGQHAAEPCQSPSAAGCARPADMLRASASSRIPPMPSTAPPAPSCAAVHSRPINHAAECDRRQARTTSGHRPSSTLGHAGADKMLRRSSSSSNVSRTKERPGCRT